jgi:hypothetical protein
VASSRVCLSATSLRKTAVSVLGFAVDRKPLVIKIAASAVARRIPDTAPTLMKSITGRRDALRAAIIATSLSEH